MKIWERLSDLENVLKVYAGKGEKNKKIVNTSHRIKITLHILGEIFMETKKIPIYYRISLLFPFF